MEPFGFRNARVAYACLLENDGSGMGYTRNHETRVKYAGLLVCQSVVNVLDDTFITTSHFAVSGFIFQPRDVMQST